MSRHEETHNGTVIAYGPDHAAAVDDYLCKQDRLADLEAAAERERDTLKVGDEVALTESITVQLYDDLDDTATLAAGSVGEVVRLLKPGQVYVDGAVVVCFPSPVFDVVLRYCAVERVKDD